MSDFYKGSKKPAPEARVTLVQLYYLHELLRDAYYLYPLTAGFDPARAYDKNLAMELWSMWRYWNEHADDVESVTLKIIVSERSEASAN